jgi:hypothetical protein
MNVEAVIPEFELLWLLCEWAYVRRAIKILIHVNQSAAEICVYISVMSVC